MFSQSSKDVTLLNQTDSHALWCLHVRVEKLSSDGSEKFNKRLLVPYLKANLRKSLALSKKHTLKQTSKQTQNETNLKGAPFCKPWTFPH